MEMKVLCVLLLGTFALADNPYEVKSTDENEVSTAGSSTEISTTPETTEPSTESPCDKSLYTKKDIKQIIDFVANTLSIDQNINKTIQSEAVPVLKKHLQRLRSTINLFSSRPGHLKHVLEDVSVTRQHMERAVDVIRRSLAKYSEFLPQYQEKAERAKALLNKFIHYKKLCDMTCGSTEVEFRNAIKDSPVLSDRFCGSIDEIHKTTQERLHKFADDHTKRIHQQVVKADKDYNEKVTTRIDDLKNIALKQFGHTMYDILNLQDLYHHMKKDLKEFNNDHWIMGLRTLNIKIDGLLNNLDSAVEHFANYCKKCNRFYRRGEPIVYRQRVDGVEKSNILDSVINNKIAEISNRTDGELHATFKELDESLNKTTMDNSFIEHLKPIQKEITDLTKKEMEAFRELKIHKLSIDMDLVKKLIADTTDLIAALGKEAKAIMAVIEDLVHK